MPLERFDICSVVIRSVGERTEQVCYDIVSKQIADPEYIKIIRKFPFIDTISQGIDFALESGSQYALFLDADVLLRDDALQMMLSEIEHISFPFFMCNFAILDFQFGCPTYAGVHIYNSEYFKYAKYYIESSRNEQRPESSIYYQVSLRHNIPSVGNGLIVGLHGYDQWLADSYRTMFVRGIKFHHRFDYIYKRLYKIFLDDPDNIENCVLLHALLDGTYYRFSHEIAPIDKQYYDPYFERIRTLLSIKEKEPIDLNYTIPSVEINRFKPDPLTIDTFRTFLPIGILEPKPPTLKTRPSLVRKIRKNLKKFYQYQKSAFHVLFKDY